MIRSGSEPLRPTPTPVPPHIAAMETALSVLHAAAAALTSIPSSTFDLRPMAASTSKAIVCLLDALDLRRDPLTALRDAVTAIEDVVADALRACEVIDGLEGMTMWIEAARKWTLVAEDQLAQVPYLPTPAREMVVARQVPTLFRLDRRTIAPAIRVADPRPAPPAPPPPPPSAELSPKERLALTRERAAKAREEANSRRVAREKEREARRAPREEPGAPAPGFVKGRFSAISRSQMALSRARELFDEIALGGIQRTALLGDEWKALDLVDQRILRSIDAIAGLRGDAVAALESFVTDAPAKDPARGFALALTLGCFEGRDGLAAVERALRWLDPAEADVRGMVAAGLKLAPHLELERVMRRWAADPDPGVRAVGLDVLGHKGWLIELEVMKALADTDEDVVLAAIQWACLGDHALRVLARDAAVERRATEHNALASALPWVFALVGLAGSVDELRGRLGTEQEQSSLVPLALVADAGLASVLVDAVADNPTKAGIDALGYVGSRDAITTLMTILQDYDAPPELKQACGFALQRITGYEYYDDVELPAERLEADDPPDPAAIPREDQTLERQVGDPRDAPADPAPDRLKLPAGRAEVWRDYLRREGPRYDSDARFRRGERYTPALSLDELDRYCITPAERRILFRELILKTGEVVPFSTDDFVAMQQESIRRWAPIAQRASSQPGIWGVVQRK